MYVIFSGSIFTFRCVDVWNKHFTIYLFAVLYSSPQPAAGGGSVHKWRQQSGSLQVKFTKMITVGKKGMMVRFHDSWWSGLLGSRLMLTSFTNNPLAYSTHVCVSSLCVFFYEKKAQQVASNQQPINHENQSTMFLWTEPYTQWTNTTTMSIQRHTGCIFGCQSMGCGTTSWGPCDLDDFCLKCEGVISIPNDNPNKFVCLPWNCCRNSL